MRDKSQSHWLRRAVRKYHSFSYYHLCNDYHYIHGYCTYYHHHHHYHYYFYYYHYYHYCYYYYYYYYHFTITWSVTGVPNTPTSPHPPLGLSTAIGPNIPAGEGMSTALSYPPHIRISLRSPTYHNRSTQSDPSVPRIPRPCPNPRGPFFRQQVQSGHRPALPISSRDSPRSRPHLSTFARLVFSTPATFHRASPRPCPPHLAGCLTARSISAWWHPAFLFPVDFSLFGYTHVHPAAPLPLPASP